MAGTSLLALIDDIASMLDDVAVLTKIAAKKTSGVLGDDLALNAQQVAGVQAEREIPVILKVAKGSFLNKLILVPSALAISVVLPQAITPLLVIGGLYLCWEGFEKIFEKFFHPKEKPQSLETGSLNAKIENLAKTPGMTPEQENEKIRGAVRTDFILSAEIIVITLGTVQTEPFVKQVLVLSTIAIAMTFGVYGLVAGIVKLDDLGLHWLKPSMPKWKKTIGQGLLRFAPILMRILGIAGTIAMFLVGGGILNHAIPAIHHQLAELHGLLQILGDFSLGIFSGGLLFLLTSLKSRMLPSSAS